MEKKNYFYMQSAKIISTEVPSANMTQLPFIIGPMGLTTAICQTI